MNVAVAGDHAGFSLKQWLILKLQKEGFTPIDLGAHDTAPSDYPDFARAVAEAVLTGKAERGVLVCGSGIGASVAANKIRGIRAGVAHDTYSAHQGVEHDDMNVLCLGSRVVGPEIALEAVRAFLRARFSGEERHARRVNKILELERRFGL
jgi:ribose 5-phosphate isomerase B